MSMNINQIFVANPITTNAATDLMYFGQSPYGAGNDAAMTYANFSAQFMPKTLTSAHIFVGNGSNVATDVAVSGDVSLANTGAMTVSKINGVSISLAGSFTTSGAFAVTQTYTGATNVTFPTSGTLATTAQLLTSPLTTKGDIWVWSTTNDRLPVGTINGQILQVSSGAATGLAYSTPTYPSASGSAGKILISDGTNNVYSTPTYPNSASSTGSFIYANGTNFVASTSLWPNTVGTAGKIIRSDGTTNAYSTSTFADTYAASTILYSNGANTVTGLATANSSVLVTTSAGVPVQSGTLTNGQMIIGSTGATPAVGTISVSGNLSSTVGAGTFALSLTGTASYSFVDETTTSRTLTPFQAMVADNAGVVTGTIPATTAFGDVFEIVGKGAGGWKLQANTGQTIHLGSSATTVAGSLASTNQFDAVQIVCVTANTTFVARSVIGNLTVA